MSGKDFDRPKYKTLKDFMDNDDTLIIKSLDCLDRNYNQIKEEWQGLSKKGIFIRVLDNPLLDTNKYIDNDLIAQFALNIVLEVLSFVVENGHKILSEDK